MSDLKTIRISELPEKTSVQLDDVLLIEDGKTTRKITGSDFLESLKTYTAEHGDYVAKSSIGVANGIAPLNGSTKIASNYLNFGTATGTVFDGGQGQVLREDLDTHIADTSAHHTHSNKSILDSITQTKINSWDNAAGGTGGVSSLTDLGITATSTELNYVDGVTSNIQTQLNTLINSVSSLSTSVGNLSTTVSGKADTSHTQSASTITAGTLGGQISTPEGTDYDTNRVRNGVLVSTDPGIGVATNYVNGTIIYVYE